MSPILAISVSNMLVCPSPVDIENGVGELEEKQEGTATPKGNVPETTNQGNTGRDR